MLDESIAELELEYQVIKVLSDYFPVARRNIAMESRLVEDLYMDSIGLVEIVMALNERFGIELPEAEVGDWKTVRDIYLNVRDVREVKNR